MLNMRASHAIVQLTERTLARGEKTKVLFVPIKITARNGHREISRHVTFILYRPTAYTLVGVHISDGWHFRNEIGEYVNKSYHDSCWRSDGIDSTLAEIYFAMCKEIAPQIAPKNVDIEATYWHNAEIIEVDEVKFDRGDFTKPIVVTWKS